MANIADRGELGHEVKCSDVDSSGRMVYDMTIWSSPPCKGCMTHPSACLAAERIAYVRVTSLFCSDEMMQGNHQVRCSIKV